MKYSIQVKEINYGVLEVEASSKEEALAKAEASYAMGHTVWDSGEYEFHDVNEIPQKSRAYITPIGRER